MHVLLISGMPRLFYPQIVCFDVSTRRVMHCHALAVPSAPVAVRNASLARKPAASAPPPPSPVRFQSTDPFAMQAEQRYKETEQMDKISTNVKEMQCKTRT